MKEFTFIFIFIFLMQNPALSQEDELIRQDLWKNPPRVNYDDILPVSYDLRDESRVSPVRNQSTWGTCWAFAANASMESTYKTAHQSESRDININLSEMFASWFVYKSPGKGKSFGLPNPKKDIMHQSGTSYQTTALLSRLGTVSEDVLPYPSEKSLYDKYIPDKLPEDYEKSNIYLKEVLQIGTIKNDAVIKLVKNLIINNGAVYAHYYSHKSSYHKSNNHTSYFNKSKSRKKTNHAVIIIGWDDNYSRENFKKSMKPARNGAWLVQNSMGTSWGDNGCFWISYEQYIESCALFIADERLTRTKHYGYDDLGCTGCMGSSSASNKGVSYWAANVFKSGGRELLTEIAFYTMDNNAFYEAYIYRLGKDVPSSPVNNNLAASIPESFIPFAGYHTVKLPENINIKLEEGEYFSVVIKIRTPDYEYPVAMEIQTSINKSVLVNEHESYFAVSDSNSESQVIPEKLRWLDGAKDFTTPRNACIKAFTIECNEYK